ncbi:hypothetical protein QRX60_48890 [Amycolatopsis mongoliensis]|uniref:Uncharacterized protein n=1 Tax=Amycolatopsis mongoliensis TaxID=715475 RepID=A0A9Y2JNN1_9PSEU|nr:hypothetical protein [Amycolatopsis sp. 4-36]WIY01843.1 hypothetical protein QRX60_48890 [Amycolatopsis sp. 4-36]
MTERPALKVIQGGTDAKDPDVSSPFDGNSISVTLSGFSAGLLERHRGGSDRPEMIVAALYKVLDEIRPLATDRERVRNVFAHPVAGTPAIVVGVVLPRASSLKSSPDTEES